MELYSEYTCANSIYFYNQKEIEPDYTVVSKVVMKTKSPSLNFFLIHNNS